MDVNFFTEISAFVHLAVYSASGDKQSSQSSSIHRQKGNDCKVTSYKIFKSPFLVHAIVYIQMNAHLSVTKLLYKNTEITIKDCVTICQAQGNHTQMSSGSLILAIWKLSSRT
ncbi:hypothetical protein Tsp_06369 [Trichinella spiralis]|uniref:hypothetical protein n=1 Tax=Trichinella spiralis TaxID=6334 RepID=UPI0001EFC0D0|nr:hypothetical protein Tsp_06369 [Trichinella spiralis]